MQKNESAERGAHRAANSRARGRGGSGNHRGARPGVRRASRAIALGAALALLGGLAVQNGLAVPSAAFAADVADVPAPTPAPATTDSATPDPATPDPATTDPKPTDPATTDPAETGPATDPATDAATDPAARPASPTQVAPRAVQPPTATTAVISVRVAGDRLPNGTVQGLQGVKLALNGAGTESSGPDDGAAPSQGVAGAPYDRTWSWTTCTSDAAGDCNFVIPIRPGQITASGVPQDTRFWVVQESNPAGWYANPTMRVGHFSRSPETTWAYRFRTDTQLRAGTLYSSTDAMPWSGTAAQWSPDRYFMRNRLDTNSEGGYPSNVSRTSGMWSQSRTNPPVIGECGINIAIIADTSGSLGTSGMDAMKSTMTNFVTAFRGTNTQMALFSFSSETPGVNASNAPGLKPVGTAAQATAFTNQYANWQAGGGTNWDRGFAEVANAGIRYDLAVLLTDGNPTVFRNDAISPTYPANSTSSAYNSLQDVDHGVFSANQLKALGTRVVALGVGPEFTARSEANLRTVSGETLGTDYFRAAAWPEATAALVALANENCKGEIGVQKMIVPNGGTIADATPAPAGWRFDASASAPGTAVAPATQTTAAGGSGKVDFGLSFVAPTKTGAVQVLETQQAGFTLLPVGSGAAARNATCTNAKTGAAVAVTNAGTAASPGFSVVGTQGQRVECKIYNQAKPPGKLEVDKQSIPASGATVQPGQSISYTLTFRNTGGMPVAVNHDDLIADLLDDAAFVGTVVAQSPLSATLSEPNGRIRVTGTIDPGTTRTVTYTVKVRDPLPATANGSVRNVVVPIGEQPPTTCAPGTPCTVHPVRAGLSWNKVDRTGVRLAGSEWTLTPLGTDGKPVPGAAIAVVDCVAANAAACTGADRDPAVGTFALTGLVAGPYELRETKAPAGFQLLRDPITVTVNSNVAYGNITNTQIEVPPIPLTGGTGSFAFLLAAGGLGAATAGGLWLQRRRNGVRV